MTSSDDSLVRACQAGNRLAFESLVHRTARLLYSHALAKLRDPHKSEDLVQECYLHAWKSVQSLDDPNKLRPWLLSILDRLIIDQVRHESRKMRKGIHEPQDVLESRESASIQPVRQLEMHEQQRLAIDALQALPDEYRQVLKLRYLGGADLEQISQQLAISNGSLRGLLQRGMKMLRERLNS